MGEGVDQNLAKWKKGLEEIRREIPKAYRSEHTVRRTLQCELYQLMQELGLRVVADYMPPRIADRPVDLIALNENQELVYAICIDTLVTLAAVKSLGSFAAENKVIITTGLLEKKVQESKFFLNPEIKHLHLQL